MTKDRKYTFKILEIEKENNYNYKYNNIIIVLLYYYIFTQLLFKEKKCSNLREIN